MLIPGKKKRAQYATQFDAQQHPIFQPFFGTFFGTYIAENQETRIKI